VRLALGAASAFCLWVAIPMGLTLASAWIEARASASWPKAPGRMLAGSIDHPTHRPRDYTLHFRYEFAVDGKRHEGTQINAGDVIDTSRFAELQERYAAGRVVSVAYDPVNPSRSVLEPGVTRGHWFLFIAPPVLYGMAALFGWGALRGG
jgi:Protein of unknown function (DUF3592)